MKVGSYDLYDSLKTAYPDNENLVTYAGYMTDELGFNLVFGNAKATFAVSNGVLRYYQLEIGGLGTRMYLTKTVLISDTDVRETPDFSDAGDYADLLQETADYVAQYDSYEDALNAMYSSSDSTDTTIDYDDIEIVTEDEEGTPTDSDTE
jgi:hypothetical protein